MFRWLPISVFLLITFTTCEKNKKVKGDPYEGPLMEMYDMETLYSDSAKLKIRLTAPKELEFENGDQEFPEGIFMEFYDKETQEKSSTLKGNHARYLKDKEIYVVTGDVVVKSLKESKKLNSEELVWNPSEKQITSDKDVRIETPCEVLEGEGLVANEDFTSYKILKPTANIFLDCE